MEEHELRTRVAMQALDFSGAFKSVVGHLRLPPAAYVPELMAPEGPSTRGGRDAMQRIRLVPQADGFPTLVVGSANIKTGRGLLRTFAYLDARHREHFGRPVHLDREAYEEFIQLVKNYFSVAQLTVTVEDPSEDTLVIVRMQERRGSIGVRLVLVAAFAALGIAAGVAYYVVF